MDKNEVNIAFEMLVQEIENVINELNHEGALAIEEKDYEKARMLIDSAQRVEDFKNKVLKLQEEWNNFSFGKSVTKVSMKKRSKKLKKGLRTPECEFRIPILESIVELGGSAKVKDVLKKVEDKMKHKLNEYDYESLPSDPREKRWAKTAQWCRYMLVTEGLLSFDSPRGIWEITEKGKEYLKNHRDKLRQNIE